MKRVSCLVLWLVIFSSAGMAGNYGIGPHIVISVPQQSFANVSNTGEGFGIKGHYNLERFPGISLRADFAILSYGDKIQNSNFIGYVETRNEALQFSFGLQYMAKLGRLGIYTAPLIGLFNYSTIQTVPDLYYNYYHYSERKDSKTNWGWSIGGGLMYDIGLGPWIDVGLKYGVIKNIVETNVKDQVIKSDATDISITVGVLFFLK